MLKKIRILVLTALVGGSLASVAVGPQVSAFNPFGTCPSDGDSQVCMAASNNEDAANLVQNIISVLLWLIGAVAVIMLIVGGFRYVTSNGSADQIKAAKNTILYAAVGLAVAILGQAIVIFVVDWLT